MRKAGDLLVVYLELFALSRGDTGRRGVIPPAFAVVVGRSVGILLGFRELVLQDGVLAAEHLVLLLETLGDALEGDIALDLPLLVSLEAGLEIGELGLLAFTESALCGAVLDASALAVDLLGYIYVIQSWGGAEKLTSSSSC